ncbi:neuron navigator 3 isoform X2 [Clarias gariepinus]|uniref:neuron navigator 3 isoform X2 n=1 Tax=Clarias gariepinus TaxID=13013 RepID=UPI00234C8C12|nr:neuron navigator 3 isoform X2 [Clarias gariepinus]
MPVVGVASKLRQPAVASRPVHTALPIPNKGQRSEVKTSEPTPATFQLSVKSELQERTGQDEEKRICKIYTDWANHYLSKAGCPRLIKDLTLDIPDGVLLAHIIQIIANEKVEDITDCPRSHSQMIENVESCLTFLEARGVSVQGLSAEDVCKGNLKVILGLFFVLSRYKQQQQQQQQYLQSLVELQQHITHTHSPKTQQRAPDMQSSVTVRYANPPPQSGGGPVQKKNTRLPGPSRSPVVGSNKAPPSASLNRRSQSFNSIDRNKPLQYASGNDRESVKSVPLVGGGMNGSISGQQLASAIPSPTTGQSWRSKSMNMKHSATSSMLASSPASSPPPPTSDRSRPSLADASKSAPGNQRSMLEKFRLVNTRMALQEEDDLSEYGDDSGMCSKPPGKMPIPSPSLSNKNTANANTATTIAANNTKNANKSLPQPKDDKNKNKSKASTPPKEDVTSEPAKKGSKIASLIPKGGKPTAAKKESAPSASSGIPKPGTKAQAASSKPAAEKVKSSKGSQGYYAGRPLGGVEGKKGSMVSSTSTSALAGSTVHPGSGGGGVMGSNGAVQLPQQQQHNHPNTAMVPPFMYRTCSENDCTAVVVPDSSLSPTKELPYNKTAKQCLEELSGEDPEARRMRTVKNIADLRQNLEETMSSLRGTQITHSTLETTFDSTVTTEVSGRGLSTLSTRPAPMSWRLGQTQPQSPRLQAGDAPSHTGSYAPSRSVSSSTGRYGDPSRLVYTAPLRRAATTVGKSVELGEKEAGLEEEVGGYMSDGDILAKNVRTDDMSSGYVTDGGVYSRNVGRVPDLPSTRELIQRVKEGEADSYDDSSSVSSGLSDSLDVGADDVHTLNSSHRSKSKQQSNQNNSSWCGAEDLKKVDEQIETIVDSPSPMEGAGHSMSQTGSWRRGMSAQTGITSPRHKNSNTTPKTPGKTDDAKASEKVKTPCKSPSMQRSPSDVGKNSGDEGKKSGLTRPPPTTGSFGFKKIPAATEQAAPKSISGKSAGKVGGTTCVVGGSRKTSLDGYRHHDDGVLLSIGGPKMPLQYRSLPRPAKSYRTIESPTVKGSGVITGLVAGGGADGGAGPGPGPGPGPGAGPGTGTANGASKRKDGGKTESGRSSPVSVNQTDKEKVSVSEQEGAALSTSPKSSPTSSQSGLRQPGSKYPDIASPTFRRLFGSKCSNSKPSSPDSTKTASFTSPLDSPGSGGNRTPDSLSNTRQFLSSSSAGSKETLSSIHTSSHTSLHTSSHTSLHTSSESIELPGPHHQHAPRLKSTLSQGMTLDRNTLPKKGLRHPPSSRQMSHEEGKEWLRSHSTGGLQDTGSPLSPPTGKYHYSNLVSPTGAMTRSNSIPDQEAFDLYGDGRVLCGSNTSLEERPRAISRSGSFRDSTDEVHGSSLSLVSSTSSLYSAVYAYMEKTEEKAHSEQIRKLRRELDASHEKVATLTSQLSANSHLVAAFEKSLTNMTGRLQSLTMTAEQKESELAELRETIEALKAQNTDAQTAIQVALNGPEHLHRVRRQQSSESVSSINSAVSHGSLNNKDLDDKKKKKKSWLRSSFKQAFGKKKSSKLQTSHDELEEMTDSSVPESPKLQHTHIDGSTQALHTSSSTTDKSSPIWVPKKRQNGHVVYKHRSRLCECTEAEAEIILQLKNELREKELKLTDIRLEALSSAHHLDQIREAMNRMQNEIELLKAENDRLKSSGNSTPSAMSSKTPRPPSETSSTSSSSSRQSLGLSLNNLNLTETIMSDLLLDDGYEGNLRKEGRSVRIVVSIAGGSNRTKSLEYLIGSIGVSGKTKWDVLDGVIRRLFKEYVFRVDPLTSLGVNSDSIVSYRIGEVERSQVSELPELLPCGYLVGENSVINITLKGVREDSIDDLVFDTLIPKPIIQRYLNLLMEHRRIILSGPSGTGKSYLANKLAHYIINKSGREVNEYSLACFNVDQKSSKDLCQYLSALAERCNCDEGKRERQLPLVVLIDNLHHIGNLSDIFNGFLNCKYHKCPYVIGTMNQGVSCSPNLELHHNFRWVLCANHTEPVRGFLGRFLRRKLIEMEIDKNTRSNELIKIIDWIPKTWQHINTFLEAHSSSDVTIGPRLFLSCPMEVEGSRVWFTDLWNFSLVPYLLEAVREGLQLYGKRAVWEDPSKWVIDSSPWSSAPLQRDSQSLLPLRPEDVGYDAFSSYKDGASPKQSHKHTAQSDSDGDPLTFRDYKMNMLMRLQEAANYSSATQSCDSDSASHHDDGLDSSLESAL